MSFRGLPFTFDSPAAAVEGMIARLRIGGAADQTESCPLGSALGRILADRVTTDRDSPPFDYASMDGYAVRLGDVMAGARLPVIDEARIGATPPIMPAAPCVVRIATGAGVPPGSDAVVKREHVMEHSECGCVRSITILPIAQETVQKETYIRRRGENAGSGATVLEPGAVLSAAAIGTLAGVGCVQPRVHKPLRVAVVTTGDELVPPEAAPELFQIRNSNLLSLKSILTTQRWIELVSGVHVRDEPEKLAEAMSVAMQQADAVIFSGGISMGHRDPVRGVIESAGAEVVFHGLPQRPGKPMLGAIAKRDERRHIPIFGLPGNPVSAMVTCARIVLPVLMACAGAARRPIAPRIGLVNPDGKVLDLWWHRLVRINDDGAAELIDARGSGDIVAGGQGDGFIEVPPSRAVDRLAAGMNYHFHAWPA